MKVKLFTHTDFDGISNSILAYLAFVEENVDVEYCNYDDVDKKVRDFWFGEELMNYDKVFITDISIKEELAIMIDATLINHKDLPKLILIDHHKTALNLNKYDWCAVNIEDEKGLCSGTSLFFEYLNENEYLLSDTEDYCFESLKEFVEIVRRYDTWEFKTKYHVEIPKKFNDLLYILGRDEFIDSILDKIEIHCDLTFNNAENLLLELRQKDIDKYIKTKNKYLIKHPVGGYNAGIVFAELYVSELGNEICKLNPDIDFVAIINPSHSVSYRTIKDVSEIAKMYEGGGHAKASVSPITDRMRLDIIKTIFK